jgi:hypothetical protein
LCEPSQSQGVSDAIAAQGKLQGTEHDAEIQWQFEPIKKRRKREAPGNAQGTLLEV